MTDDRSQDLQYQLKISILRAALKLMLKHTEALKLVKDKAWKALEDTE